jgi:PIN domain nuclease of toxin-antitoxin system
MRVMLDTHAFLWWLDGDPFDRMLIAQSQSEGLSLISNEKVFDGYAVERPW